jgi:hypothetical protein
VAAPISQRTLFASGVENGCVERPEEDGRGQLSQKEMLVYCSEYLLNATSTLVSEWFNNLLHFNSNLGWHSRRQSKQRTVAAYILMDNGAPENLLSRRIARRLRNMGCRSVKEGMMRVKTAKEQVSELEERERISLVVQIGGYCYSGSMTVLDMDEFDLILRQPWFLDVNLKHTIDYESKLL